jgi:gamma-glutamylcyclotransferase (GGCT)/AIG2-like uncharacterized protein YtfP
MRLFLYGTLLAPGALSRHAGRALPAIPAELPGWRRVALRGSRYPTLRRGRGRVAGLLVEVGPAALRRLAVYEGARYRLIPVVARTASGPRRAHAWIGDAPTRREWP